MVEMVVSTLEEKNSNPKQVLMAVMVAVEEALFWLQITL